MAYTVHFRRKLQNQDVTKEQTPPLNRLQHYCAPTHSRKAPDMQPVKVYPSSADCLTPTQTLFLLQFSHYYSLLEGCYLPFLKPFHPAAGTPLHLLFRAVTHIPSCLLSCPAHFKNLIFKIKGTGFPMLQIFCLHFPVSSVFTGQQLKPLFPPICTLYCLIFICFWKVFRGECLYERCYTK